MPETGERLAHIEGQLEQLVPRLDRIQKATEEARVAAIRVAEASKADALTAVEGFHTALTAMSVKLEMKLDEAYVTRAEFMPVRAIAYTLVGTVGIALIGWAFKVLVLAGDHVGAAGAAMP